MSKPNCYDCEYRGSVPGDTHSRCCYPGVNSDLFGLFDHKNGPIRKKLNIQANAHGVRNGWFIWPSNFDPIWLENCDGFKKKEKR